MNRLNYIKKTYLEFVGGGCTVDFVELNNGLLVGINDDCVVLYKNIEQFYDGEILGSIYIENDFLSEGDNHEC